MSSNKQSKGNVIDMRNSTHEIEISNRNNLSKAVTIFNKKQIRVMCVFGFSDKGVPEIQSSLKNDEMVNMLLFLSKILIRQNEKLSFKQKVFINLITFLQR